MEFSRCARIEQAARSFKTQQRVSRGRRIPGETMIRTSCDIYPAPQQAKPAWQRDDMADLPEYELRIP